MISAILIVLLLAIGGFALTYLIDDEGPMLWRVAAGVVISQCIFGTLIFIISYLIGFGTVAFIVAGLLTILPVAVFASKDKQARFAHDRAKAKGKLQGANIRKAFPFFYYLFFFVLFVLFFDRAYLSTDQGIFTGGSQNLGDLPFHLGIIFGITDGGNFPPMNPSFAGARLSYPFVPDLLTAAFIKLGVGLRESLLVQNVAWAFSLLVILENFVYRLVRDHLAAKAAPAILFFCGGLGFLWFFSDLSTASNGFLAYLSALPKDYTIGDQFRWGNSLVTLLMTQRSLLLGLPMTLIILGGLWKIFTTKFPVNDGEGSAGAVAANISSLLSPLLFGLLAGTLVLVHLHSLFVLFIVTAFLFFLRFDRWREWLAFGLGVCVIAIPELAWSLTGSASHATKFFEFHFGWDAGRTNIVWFWVKNTGIFIPLIALGIYAAYTSKQPTSKDAKQKQPPENVDIVDRFALIKFYIPFAFLFVLANVAKLAPWEWDNIKVLIYWFVGSLPFVGTALAWMWRGSKVLKFGAVVCFLSLILSGGLDVWRTVSRQVNYKVFDAEAVVLANRVKALTKPDALILNAPTYNTAAVLTGRQSLMRYPGHLMSHGIDYAQREAEIKTIYRGGPAALALFDKYGIEYVLVTPDERNTLSPNMAFFDQFPVVAEAGQYKLYDVRKPVAPSQP